MGLPDWGGCWADASGMEPCRKKNVKAFTCSTGNSSLGAWLAAPCSLQKPSSTEPQLQVWMLGVCLLQDAHHTQHDGCAPGWCF